MMGYSKGRSRSRSGSGNGWRLGVAVVIMLVKLSVVSAAFFDSGSNNMSVAALTCSTSCAASIAGVVDDSNCLLVTLVDQFGDDWGGAGFRYWAEVAGDSSEEVWAAPSCDCPVLMGCLEPFSEAVAGSGDQVYHLGVVPTGLIREVARNWEMYWTVQVVKDGELLQKYHGGFNTSVSFSYSPTSSKYTLMDGSNVWLPPVNMSCLENAWESRVSIGDNDDSPPHSYGNETGLYGLSNTGGYFETTFIITDQANRDVMVSHSLPKSCSEGGNTAQNTLCLEDGAYELRSLGQCDPLRDDARWANFCDVTDGGALEQFFFNISDGVCLAGVRRSSEAVCGRTDVPSGQPTSHPSGRPTELPILLPTALPSRQPSGEPSCEPSGLPTGQPSGPSGEPSGEPTCQPTRNPSSQPSTQPTGKPSNAPTQPTGQPTGQPTIVPTLQPTVCPSGQPTSRPVGVPSGEPSGQPSNNPTSQPSGQPSNTPTGYPTQPTGQPSSQPSSLPSAQPTGRPSGEPSGQPIGDPSSEPSALPSCPPTATPTGAPSTRPSGQPTEPSGQPTSQPSTKPSSEPSVQPSSEPSGCPTTLPSQLPTENPSQPSGEPTGRPSHQPSTQPTGQPTVWPSADPSVEPSAAPSLSPPCNPGDRAYCNYRGVCTVIEGVTSCVCDDYFHYWPSELCSTRHSGRELSLGQLCYPDAVDQYCIWMGICSPDGGGCVCDEPNHRLPEEQCKIWRDVIPTASPVMSPTIVNNQTVELSKPLAMVCSAGDRGHCNNRGRCSSAGDRCICDDVHHYWSSEKCSTYHWGRELELGQTCYPATVDHYCNYLGVCADNGLACECFDSAHRSPVDACKTWSPDNTTSVLISAPAILSDGQVCEPGDGEYCSFNGYCVSSGDGCSCWDEAHYWSSDLCSVYHHGPEQVDLEDCCVPGFVDYYCGWLGECSSDGSTCICFDDGHYWSSDRCQQYHDGPDPKASPSEGACPALLSIPEENTERSGGGNSSFITGSWEYGLIGIVSVLLIIGLVSLGGYKYYHDYYLRSNGSAYSAYSSTSKSTVNSRAERSFNNAIFKHPMTAGGDMELSIVEDNVDDDVKVDLTNMAGIYSSTSTSESGLMPRPTSQTRPSSLQQSLSRSLSKRSTVKSVKLKPFDSDVEKFSLTSIKLGDELVTSDDVEFKI